MTGKILYAFEITLGLVCDIALDGLVRRKVKAGRAGSRGGEKRRPEGAGPVPEGAADGDFTPERLGERPR